MSDIEEKDIHRQSLDTLLGAPMEPGRFLHLAIGIAAALEELHRKNIVHKNFEPRNILIDPETGVVMIKVPRDAEIALPYMSPEQTGHIDRVIDYRSDLYSLGIVLYEMLTGRLPFDAKCALEWSHSHIAIPALPPAEIVQDLPQMISNILMKLLAKDAEERYQTASGLKSDLEKCLQQLEAAKEITSFELGGQDISDRLMIPHKLYGRQKDIAALTDAFGRMTETGTPELVMVTGHTGIGKTSLVRELHKPVISERGFFISGKFDNLKYDFPYATFAKAFQDLVRQVLACEEVQIAEWGKQIRKTLGVNAQLIVNIIPQLELIIGKQPPVPELPPAEAKNRFDMVFTKFIGLFAARENPLVLFLDDMQWADSASLRMFKHIMIQADMKYLLMVGAYRSNEVGPDHPLLSALDAIRKSDVRVNLITLCPLAARHLDSFIEDALRCKSQSSAELSRLIFKKTHGNPFFVIQFLKTLYEEGLLEFDRVERLWKCPVTAIRDRGYTSNVADLMVEKLKRLTEGTIRELGLAASLGSRFDIRTLAVVSGISEEDARAAIEEAVRNGLVLRGNGDYVFLHDRIQEAAYSLIPEEQRPELHHVIGRLLLADTPGEKLEERVFDIADHLNRGSGLITDTREKESLCRLNTIAGRKAMASIAYAEALKYLDKAAELLPHDSWSTRHEETFDLYLNRAECEYLTGNYGAAEQLFDMLLSNAETDLERVHGYRLRSRLYQVTGRFDEALTLILDALRLIGVTLPDSDEALRAETVIEMAKIKAGLAGRCISDLVEAPPATDLVGVLTIGLLVEALGPAYAAAPSFYSLISAKAVSSSLRYGNTSDSCTAFSSYAIVLIAVLSDVSEAFEFSGTALSLMEKFDIRQKGIVMACHGGLIIPWRRHIAEGIPLIEQGLSALLDAGDFLDAAYLIILAVWAILEKGEPLEELLKAAGKYSALARTIHNETAHDTVLLCERLVASLKGLTAEPASFDSDSFSEADCLARFTRKSWHAGIAYYYVMKEIACFIYGQYDMVLDAAGRAEPVLSRMMAMPVAATLYFYRALAMAALYSQASAEQKCEFVDILKKEVQRFKYWADNCPQNYQNRYALVSAELARIEGSDLEAERMYEEAAKSAHDNGFLQNEAIAFEMAARFYHVRGLETIADSYLQRARSCYVRWGAGGKVNRLEQLFPQLRVIPLAQPLGREHLDVLAVVRASQAISGRIVLDELLDALMSIVIENAGAQKGYLLSVDNGELSVLSEAGIEQQKVVVRNYTKDMRVAPSQSILPVNILNYVSRSFEKVVLEDATVPNLFSSDEYISRREPKSVLCLPIMRQNVLVALLYLENDLITGAFTANRLALLEMLAAQAAISLENARLYEGLKREIDERARTETELRESEKKFRALTEKSLVGVYLIQDGSLTYINSRFAEIFGYEAEELSNSNYEKIILPADLPYVKECVRKKMEGEELTSHYSFRGIKKSGEIFDAEVYSSRTVYRGDVAIIGTLLDITERKRSEKALLMSEDRYKALYRDNPTMIFTLNSDGIVLSVNPFAESQLGYSIDELEGRSVLDVFYEDDRPIVARQLEHCLQNPNKVFNWQLRKVRKDGVLLWVEELAQAVHALDGSLNVLVVCQDITERRLSEQYLAVQYGVARVLADFNVFADSGVKLLQVVCEKLNWEIGETWIVDKESNRLRCTDYWQTPSIDAADFVDSCKLMTFGMGQGFPGWVWESGTPLWIGDVKEDTNFLRVQAAAKIGLNSAVAFPVWLGGQILSVMTFFTRQRRMQDKGIFPVLSSIGTQIGQFIERRQNEDALRKAHDELEHRVVERTKELYEANIKLQELDRLKSMFIASMSHELRTPLNSVIGFSTILLNEWAGPMNQEQKENLAVIVRSGKHLLSLINDMIDVSKVEAGKVETDITEFDLYDLVLEAHSAFADEIGKKTIELKLDVMHQNVRTDRMRLLQCLFNLISNASKFTEQGTITISAARCGVHESPQDKGVPRETGKEAPALTQDNECVEIAIADTGIGIKEEDMPKLFIPFVRLESPLKSKVSGTGLGLYLTKKLVTEILEGEISCVSKYGEGSKFTIKIPVAI